MSMRGPSLPDSRELSILGVHLDGELHAGKQSRVFAATVDDRRAVLKFIERRFADVTVLTERMRVAVVVAAELDAVVAPTRIDGALVQPVGDWLVTATPFVDGVPADVADTSDAKLLGQTLARLHDALARLPPFALPSVAGLDGVDDAGARRDRQLLHGDFGGQNTIATPAGLRVFDFDDCGYGPPAYDVANSLYMVMFDAETTGHFELYEAFRPAFLEGYADVTGADLDLAAVGSLIDVRIAALGRWLDDLSSAPIGIRTSSPEWRATLRAFVLAHGGTARADDR